MCTTCGSVYDIKHLPIVEERATRARGHGFKDSCGFFNYFHAVQADLRPGAQQFIVLVQSRPVASKIGPQYPVFVAKVTRATPQLKAKSFEMSKPRIYSKVSFDCLKPWFDIPYMNQKEKEVIAGRILQEYFAKKSPAETPTGKTKNVVLGSSRSSRVKTLDELRTQLRGLRRKRNCIRQLENRQKAGEYLDSTEEDLLACKSDVMKNIKEAEEELRLRL